MARRDCLALALALAALAVAVAVADHSHCQRLGHRSARLVRWERAVWWRGRERSVALVCGAAPACAAAELLRAALERTLALRNVTVRRGERALRSDAPYADLPYQADNDYEQVLVGVSMAWKPQRARPWHEGHTGGMAAPRLVELGASDVPVRRRLFARLPTAANSPVCADRHTYSFYANITTLRFCRFTNQTSEVVDLYVVTDPADRQPQNSASLDALLAALKERAAAAALAWRLKTCERAELQHLLARGDSLLFLDYDIWDEHPQVVAVQPPPCLPQYRNCSHELDPSVALRVADEVLKTWAPELFKYIHNFSVTIKNVKDMLELEANGTSIEEGACAIIFNEYSKFLKLRHNMYKTYTVVVFSCKNHEDNPLYLKFLNKIGPLIRQSTVRAYFGINFQHQIADCLDENDMRSILHSHYTTRGYQFELMGVLAPGNGAAAPAAAQLSALANDSRVPLLLYDEADVQLGAWLLTPRSHSTLALTHFIRTNGWSRLAIISEATVYSRKILDDIRFNLKLVREVHLNLTDIKSVFTELRYVNARIIFINADTAAAALILKEAIEQSMAADSKYVWIVREWYSNNDTGEVRHYTICPSWHNGIGVPADEGMVQLRKVVDEGPKRYGAAIADGLWLLAQGFLEVFRRLPGARNDMRSDLTMTALESCLHDHPVEGSMQRLQFKDRSVETSWMYVEEWRGARRRLLATWRVNASARSVTPLRESERGALAAPPHDGAARCLLPGAGDAFAPPCRDWAAVCGLLALVLAPLAGWLARRHVRRRLERRDRELLVRLLARRDLVASTLADWLVDRAALHLREELGAGQFGRVHLALLRVPGRATRVVAAKALHHGATPAEESDFLRETCTIASLAHPHIIRLVGVCVEGGPPLMLTEVAFFGDLHKYLRERRHLLEDADVDSVKGETPPGDGEAAHVSAEALTRLAREAASALAYLATRGMMHRDVRAANCLVDSTRSLKLGDFGMARETGASEYVCIRRTVVPVRWMAPESLMHGVFSSASDVWSLGVLVLEVVTLGARPFGDMALPRVLEYVSAGGLPPLPLDATPAARALARLCWRHEAAARPSACEVEAYLAAHPRALRAALSLDAALVPPLATRSSLYLVRGPTDTDSGYGEPCTPDDLPIHLQYHDSTDPNCIKY